MSEICRTYLDKFIESMTSGDSPGRIPEIDVARLVIHMYRDTRSALSPNVESTDRGVEADFSELSAIAALSSEIERMRTRSLIYAAWLATIRASGLGESNSGNVSEGGAQIRAVNMRPRVVFDRHCMGGSNSTIGMVRLAAGSSWVPLPVFAVGDSDGRNHPIDDMPVGALLLQAESEHGCGQIGCTRVSHERIVS